MADRKSDYYGDRKAIEDPDEYRRVGAFIIPEAARWENLARRPRPTTSRYRLDDVLEALENKYPEKLKGLRDSAPGHPDLEAQQLDSRRHRYPRSGSADRLDRAAVSC